MQFITLKDYLLLPFYLFIIFAIALRFREKHYPPGHPWRKYFLNGLLLKMCGSLFISLLYVYYYRVGDTLGFFRQSVAMNSAFSESPIKWINLIFQIPAPYDGAYIEYTSQIPLYHFGGNGAIISICAVVGMLSFNSFLISSVLFGAFSYMGIWALFRLFARQYSDSTHLIAWSVVYFPSVIVWGSGVFKDTVCMFGLGWITFLTFNIFVDRKISARNLLGLLLCIILVAIIKIYIIAAFLPALFFWILANFAHTIKHPFSRFLVRFMVPLLVLGLSLLLANVFSERLGIYSLENVTKTSSSLRENILADSKASEGSAYDLGDMGSGPLDLLKKFPQAVNVTLFRPYPWESGKAIMLVSSLESTILLLLTLFIFFRVGPLRIYRIISKNPNIQFCLIFTLIFAFAVGISTFNFGTLSRYKIPCMPFYGIALTLLYRFGTRRQQDDLAQPSALL